MQRNIQAVCYVLALFYIVGFDTEQKKVVNLPGPKVEHICGMQILDNHAVNLLTSAIMAWFAPNIALLMWSFCDPPVIPYH